MVLKEEIQKLKLRQWRAMKANIKDTTYNPFLAEYLKGYICALSTIEGLIAEIEEEGEATE